MIAAEAGDVWHFGDAEFDERRGLLNAGGSETQLDRNCAALLSLLLRASGAAVGKDQLLKAGWPDRIVYENSLAKAISRLRQALGSQGDALQTVYGFGYRLAVAATRAEHAAAPEPGTTPASALPAAPAPAAKRRTSVMVGAVAALAIIAAVVGAAVWSNRSGGEAAMAVRAEAPIIGDAADAIGRLLWVDDHPQNNVSEKQFFEHHRIAVHNVLGSVDALRLLAMYDYSIVISDMGRGEDRLAGLRLVEQMRSRGDRTPVVIYTVRPSGAAAQRDQKHIVAEAGAQGVAVTPQEIRAVILKAFGNPPPRETG